MKRLLFVLLFLISFTSFGLDLMSFINHDINIATGFALPSHTAINDFTNIKSFTGYSNMKYQDGYLIDDSITNSWYTMDFAEDPFDGVLNIVVGQPSTSTTVTLVISCLLLFLISKKVNPINSAFPTR